MLKKINIRAVVRFVFFGYLACLTFLCLEVSFHTLRFGHTDFFDIFMLLFYCFAFVGLGLLGYHFQRKKERLKSGFCYFMWVFFQAAALWVISLPSLDSALNCSDSGGIWVYEERECYYDCKDGVGGFNCLTPELKERLEKRSPKRHANEPLNNQSDS